MTGDTFPKTHAEAESFDRVDTLAGARDAFDLPEGVTYLVGHSLGPPPRAALASVSDAAHSEWKDGLVGSWNSAGWINLPGQVGARLARLVGVASDEIIVCDSVSLNIFKLASALLEMPGRARRLIVEESEFPTDQYMIERLASLWGAEFLRAGNGQGRSALASGGGVLVKSLVDFRTGEIENVPAYEAAADESGGAMIWDLSHATGVLNLTLADWGARYAAGCTYKYLNGGPGAPAFIYVRGDCVDALETPLPGWLGHAAPFAFDVSYTPAPGVQRFVSGTPGILSMSALNGALDVFDGLDMEMVHAKAQRLGDMCLYRFAQMGLECNSPGIGAPRGGHVSLLHAAGYPISRALSERGHKTDFRTPDIIRFGLSPLFLRYADVWATLDDLADILETQVWRDPRFSVREQVT